LIYRLSNSDRGTLFEQVQAGAITVAQIAGAIATGGIPAIVITAADVLGIDDAVLYQLGLSAEEVQQVRSGGTFDLSLLQGRQTGIGTTGTIIAVGGGLAVLVLATK